MKIFIGFDSRSNLAYEVCRASILKLNNSLEVIPIIKNQIPVYIREDDPLSSTEFTFTRFLVPYLCNYQGWAIFCDCDFVWLADPYTLYENRSDDKAVLVVKHDYVPLTKIKMNNQAQHFYERKNWSSMILWNCEHPSNRFLTPDIVNNESGKFLHQFRWLTDKEIGSLDCSWNWLVGYYKEPSDGNPKALHYTDGGPWLEEYKNCEYSNIWNKFSQTAQITK